VTVDDINYLSPLRRYRHERPYRLQLPAGLIPMPVTNLVPKPYQVRVYDISSHTEKFTLDLSGFQFSKCPVAVGDWNEQAITKTYLPSLLDWVVTRLGSTSGLVYSFNVCTLRPRAYKLWSLTWCSFVITPKMTLFL
jgi:hypothetical protein